MDGDHSNMGSMKLPHSHSTPAGVDGGSRTPPTTPKKGGKMLAVRIQMLDDSVTMFQLQAKALGRVLFEQVCKQLHLLEADYFGLEYQEPNGTRYWLDLEKPLSRQVGLTLVDTLLRFCVKFYTPDPAQLEEEFTRYLYCLQIKRDLCQGLLQCNDNTAALMASYIVQAECGDYVIEDYPDHTYLSTYKFTPNQDQELERRIMENHKKHAGQSPAEADLNLLETSRRCELYGMKMHPAKDHEGVPLNLAVAHMGIVVFQNYTKINTFSWAKIRKISFKRKRFLVKLHPEGYGYYKDTVEFFFEGRNDCKNFWKKCVENHGFFRCSMVKRVPRQKTRVLSRGSSFRYSGKTQKQIVEFVRENYVKRQTFQRSQSFRHSNSVHSSVANVGTSLSAHPLLPLGDNAVVGTQASLSCGSVHLSSERRRPSPPLHAADIHDPLPTSPSPPLTTSLSPPTSLTSSPQHFYPHEEERRYRGSPAAYRRHNQGQTQSNTTLSIQTTARRKSHGSVSSGECKAGGGGARGKADGRVSKHSASKGRHSTSNDSLSGGKGGGKTSASKTRYSTSNDSLSSGNKTSVCVQVMAAAQSAMESHYSTSNDSLSYGNTTTTSLRSKSESSYDKSGSRTDGKKAPSISQGNLKSSFSTSNDSLSYGTAGGGHGKGSAGVYGGSKSKSSSSSYGSLSQSSSKVSKGAARVPSPTRARPPPGKPRREQVPSPTRSVTPAGRKGVARSKSPRSRGHPVDALQTHVTTLPKAKHVSRYTWQRSASCRDLHVDTKFEESAKPVDTVDKRGYYDTVYMQDRKQDSPVTKYDENLHMRYKTCTKKKSVEELPETRIYSSSYPGTTSSLSTESGGNDEGGMGEGGSDCVLITAIGGDGSLEEMALSHDDLSHDSYELLEEEEGGSRGGGGMRSYEGTRSCSLDSEPEMVDDELGVGGEVFQMDDDEGEGRREGGMGFADEPLRDFRSVYEDPRPAYDGYRNDFRSAYERPKYDRPKFGLESSEESGSGVDSNLDPEHVDYGECRSDEGSMSSREGCVGFIYNEYGEKIMVKGFKDVDRGLTGLTFGGYEPKMKLEVTKMASDDSKSSYENVKDVDDGVDMNPKQTRSHFTEYNAKCEPGLVIGFDSPRETRKVHMHNPIERAKSDPFARPKRHMLTHQKSIDLTPADSCSDLETHDGVNVLGSVQSEFNIPYTLHKRQAMNGTAPGGAPGSLRSCEPIYAEIADDLKKSSFDSTRHGIYAEIGEDANKREMDSPKQGIYAEITDELRKSGIDLSKGLGLYAEIGDLKKSSTDTDLAKRDASLTISDDLNKSLPDCFADVPREENRATRLRNEPIYAEIDDLSDRELDNRINLEDFPPINEPIYAQVTKPKKSPKKPVAEKRDQSVPVETFVVVLPEETPGENVADRNVPVQSMGSSSSIPELEYEGKTPSIEISDTIDLASLEPLGEDRWANDDIVGVPVTKRIESGDQKVPSFDEVIEDDRKLLVHNLSLEMKSSESFRKLDRKVLSAEERGSKGEKLVKSPSKGGKGAGKGKTLGVRRVKSAEKRSPNVSRESSVTEIINMDEERKFGSSLESLRKTKKLPKADGVKSAVKSPPKSPKALRPEEVTTVCIKHNRSPPKSPRSLKSGETKFVFITDSKSPPKSPSSLKPEEVKVAESKSPPKSPKVREREGTIFVYNISDARSPPVSPNTLKPDEVSSTVYVESKSPPKSPKVREREGTIFVYNISDTSSPLLSPKTLKPKEVSSTVCAEARSPPKSPKVREIDGTKVVFISDSPPKSPKLLKNEEVILTNISEHKSPPRSPKTKKTPQKVPATSRGDEESLASKTPKVPRPSSTATSTRGKRLPETDLPVVAPSLQRKRDRSPVLFARGRLGTSEGSGLTALAQSASPSASRRAKSLDAPVVSVRGLPPADAFSSNDDTVEGEDGRIADRRRRPTSSASSPDTPGDPGPEPLEPVREETEVGARVEPGGKPADLSTKPEPKPEPKLVETPAVAKVSPVEKPPIPKKPAIPPKPVVKVAECNRAVCVDVSKEKRNFEPVDLPTEVDVALVGRPEPEVGDGRETESEGDLKAPAHLGSLHKESSGEYERFDSIDLPSEIQDGNYFLYPDVVEAARPEAIAIRPDKVSVILEESEEDNVAAEEYREDINGSPDVWVSVEDLREPLASEPGSPPYETASLPDACEEKRLPLVHDIVGIDVKFIDDEDDVDANDMSDVVDANEMSDVVDANEMSDVVDANEMSDVVDANEMSEVLDANEISDIERVSDFEERDETSTIDLAINVESPEVPNYDVESGREDKKDAEWDEEQEKTKLEDDNYNEEIMKSIVETCLEEERRELEGRDELTEEMKSFGKENSREEEPLYDSVKDECSMIEEATVSYEMEDGDYTGRDKGEIEEDEEGEEGEMPGGRTLPVRIERVKSEEEPSTSSSFALPRRELSSTWRPFLLESSGSSSLEEGFFPPDDSAHLADEEETSSTSNNHPEDFHDDPDFPTGFGYPVGLSGAEMIIGYGSPFSLSRTLSRISERSTTSEQERSDFEDDSTKPSSRSPSMDDESLLSSDHQPSLSSDPPSTGAAAGEDGDPDSPRTPEGAVVVPSDEEWPSPPDSGSPFGTPVVSHVETFYVEIRPEEARTVTVVEPPGGGDESSTDENHTLHDEDLQLSSSAGTLEDTVRLAARRFGSLSEDTSVGLSDWSSHTVRHRASYEGGGVFLEEPSGHRSREKSPSRAKSDTCLDESTSQRAGVYYTSKSLTNVDHLEPAPLSSSERPVKVVRAPYYSRTDSSERSPSRHESTSESTSLECVEPGRAHTPSNKIPVARPKYPYYSSAKSPPSDASSSSVEVSAERVQRVTKRRKSQPKRRHRVTVEMEVRDGHIVEIPASVSAASVSQPKLQQQSSTSSSEAKMYLSKQSSV